MPYLSCPVQCLFSVAQVEKDNGVEHCISRLNAWPHLFFAFRLWLGDVYGLANHKASMQNKHQDDRVELENSAFGEQTKRNIFVRPALRNPVSHERGDGQSGRDGSAFEVFRFTALVLGQYSHSHIEPGKTGETAENEESQEDVVKGGANTQCVPSKYFDLPLLSLGSTATVTLNRARRVRPQRTKKVRKTWSRVVRIPSANAAAAGARPNEI